MKHRSNIVTRFLFVSTFTLLALTSTAQFKKPLTSPRDRVESSDAKWNVGILGGGNLTTWLHFHSPKSSSWFLKNYKAFDTITNSLGYFGGIGVERMLKSNLSVGLKTTISPLNGTMLLPKSTMGVSSRDLRPTTMPLRPIYPSPIILDYPQKTAFPPMFLALLGFPMCYPTPPLK